MKLNKLFIVLIAVFTVLNVEAQTQPTSAKEIIAEAKTEAAKTDKNVFVMFHASWCGWCHKMDTAMNDKKVKAFFDKNFVITHITILERGDKAPLNTPGGMELLKTYHGDKGGIPFWFVLDKNGKFLADSRRPDALENPGENVGCPARPEEVAYFVKVLKKTSDLSNSQLDLIQQRFLKN